MNAMVTLFLFAAMYAAIVLAAVLVVFIWRWVDRKLLGWHIWLGR